MTETTAPETTAAEKAAAEKAAQPTPAEAWELLRSGNERFVSGEVRHPNQNAARRSSLTEAQHPVAAIFGCSDSRLAAEIIFDVGLGDVFVVRTAGQVIDSAVLGSLEFSVDVLNVPLVIVLGHDSCGAVNATMAAAEQGEMPAGSIRDLVERILPSVLSARRSGVTGVNETVEEHVRQTADRLLEHSRALHDAVAEGRTAVVGVTYRLAEGRADLVTEAPGS